MPKVYRDPEGGGVQHDQATFLTAVHGPGGLSRIME